MSDTQKTKADKFLTGVLKNIRLEKTYPEYFKKNDRKDFYGKLRPLYRRYVEQQGWSDGDLLICIIVTVASDRPLSRELLIKIFEADKEFTYKLCNILSNFIDTDLIFEHWLDELDALIYS